MDKKICSKCKCEKYTNEFYYNTNHERHSAQCKICVIENRKEYRLNNLEKFKNKDKEYYKKNKEDINLKNRERWNLNKDVYSLSNKKWREENKDYISQKQKEYRELNKETLSEKDKIKGKEYYLNNKKKCNERNKKNYNENKEKYLKRNKLNRESKKEYYREMNRIWTFNKRSNDKEFKIKCTLRDRIRFLIKTGKMKKLNQTIDLIGCTVEELKLHIELQFKEGMSWDNYGKFGWHIDHINPCASFDLTNPEEHKKCFHFTNLQPLWWIDNLKKGSKTA
jgi:YHS domain-containing protein